MCAPCREVLESFLLFMRLQNGHKSKSTLKHLNPAVEITLSQLPRGEEPEPLGYRVQVLSSGLGAYFVDGRLFLKQLCEHGEALRCLLKHTADCDEGVALLQLKSRRIGDCLNVSCFEIEGFSSSDDKQPVIRESVEPRQEQLPSTSLLISYRLTFSSLEELRREIDVLSTHLHLMYLINPDVSMKLTVEDVSRVVTFCVDFKTEPFKVLTKTPFKLATSLQHFIKDTSVRHRSKLCMLKGDTYTIPGSIGALTSLSSFKIFSTAAVVPHLQLRNKKKIPANKLCKQLHVFVFGPFNTPMMVANSQANFPLSCLAEWDNYGLNVRQNNREETRQGHSTSSSVSPSFLCELSNTRSSTPSLSSSVSATHLLVLFIFLEESSQRHTSLTGDSHQWRRDMELLHQLRQEFQNIVVTHSRKFQSSVHSVLNKLICNYGSHAKTSGVMSAAIPLISDAVTSIVKNSSNEEFKRMCRELTEAENEVELKSYVNQKLWKMAQDKLQVTGDSDSSTRNPDEPTSPEIIQATSSDTSGANGAQRSRKDDTSVDDHQREDERLLMETTNNSQQSLTHTHTHSTDKEEHVDFTQHTLSTTNVLKTKLLLSKTTRHETRTSDNNNVDNDCFSALEVVESMTDSLQQMREEDYNDMELTDVQIVCHNEKEDSVVAVGELHMNQPSADGETISSKEDLKESQQCEIDGQDCLDVYSPTQAISSPSLLDFHETTTHMSPVNMAMEHSNYNDLECVINENTTDSDVTIADDDNISESTLRESGAVSYSQSSNHSDLQPGTNDGSFTELEHFDEDSSLMCRDQTNVVEHHVTPPDAKYSNGFDELEYFDDDDSTYMECTENHNEMISFRNVSDIHSTVALQPDTQEQDAHNIDSHDDYNELKCTDDDTPAWSDKLPECHHHPALPDATSEQCLPEEEAATSYPSDEEWEKLAHTSSARPLTNNDTTVEPTQQREHEGAIGSTTPPPSTEQFDTEHQEDCSTPTVPGECDWCSCISSEGDSFDQLELCGETPTTPGIIVEQSPHHVTMQDFDWD